MKRKTEDTARGKIKDFLAKNIYRPVLVGELAMHIGHLWSLFETEQLVEKMIAEGVLREASQKEMQRFDLRGFFLV